MPGYPTMKIKNSSDTDLVFLTLVLPDAKAKINPKTYIPEYNTVGKCAAGETFSYEPDKSLVVLQAATAGQRMPVKRFANNVVIPVEQTVSTIDVNVAKKTFTTFKNYEGEPSSPMAKSINNIILKQPPAKQAQLLNEYFKSVSAGFDFQSWLSISNWARCTARPYAGTYYVYHRNTTASKVPFLPKPLAKLLIATDGSIVWQSLKADGQDGSHSALSFGKGLKLTSPDSQISLEGVFHADEQGHNNKVSLYFIGSVDGQDVIVQPDKIPETTVSLSSLVKKLGGSWPSEIPDIALSFETVKKTPQGYRIWAEIDLVAPAKSSLIWKNLMAIVGQNSLVVAVDISVLETRLTAYLDTISVPGMGMKPSLSFTNPQVILSVAPAFKFVTAKIIGDTSFSLFGEKIDVIASMVIDNIEANVGIEIKGDHQSLPSPPILKGIHFDQFGVDMGVFFEPPGLDFGVTGDFHIGQQPKVKGKDDSFGIVLNVEGEEINPAYLSFYVAQLNLTQVIEIFTNTTTAIDFPVSFTDLSFYWAEEPIALPDGTLAPLGLAFSADVDVAGFDLYGQFKLDLTHGIQAEIAITPISLGPLFSLSGAGKGVSIKVDANGNPVKNNRIIQKNSSLKTKELVKPGGPVAIIRTDKSPYFTIDFKASLLELEQVSLSSTIGKDGMTFDLDFGAVLKDHMACTLKDWDNFKGDFSFGIDKNLSLPLGLGHLHLEALIDANLGIAMNNGDLNMSAGGGFDFEGLSLQIPEFSVGVNIKSMESLLSAIGDEIEKEVGKIFADILGDAAKWAEWVGKQIIQGVDDVAKELKNVFKSTMQEAAAIMKGAEFAVDTIASGLSTAFNATSEAAAATLKAVGFAASEVTTGLRSAYRLSAEAVADALKGAGYVATAVASSLKSVYGLGAHGVADALKGAGYAAHEVASGLKSAYELSADGVAYALKGAGYGAQEVASSLKSVYGLSVQGVAQILKGAGYAANEVASGLKDAYGLSAEGVAAALKGVGYAANEVASGIRSAYNLSAQGAAAALKGVGYAASQVASGLQSAYGLGAQGVAEAMRGVGYAANTVASGLKTAFNLSAQGVADALKGAGYAASEVLSGLKDVFNLGGKGLDTILKGAGYAASTVENALKDAGYDIANIAKKVIHDLNPTHW